MYSTSRVETGPGRIVSWRSRVKDGAYRVKDGVYRVKDGPYRVMNVAPPLESHATRFVLSSALLE